MQIGHAMNLVLEEANERIKFPLRKLFINAVNPRVSSWACHGVLCRNSTSIPQHSTSRLQSSSNHSSTGWTWCCPGGPAYNSNTLHAMLSAELVSSVVGHTRLLLLSSHSLLLACLRMMACELATTAAASLYTGHSCKLLVIKPCNAWHASHSASGVLEQQQPVDSPISQGLQHHHLHKRCPCATEVLAQ
eukprot:GHUV01049462.1.p1 GENE.GHUV01049462.1~~GHUV01049462.1.p1  ORF type:complete len:190 (-),score=33.78 GHUV01049462.1:1840-2409(-)